MPKPGTVFLSNVLIVLIVLIVGGWARAGHYTSRVKFSICHLSSLLCLGRFTCLSVESSGLRLSLEHQVVWTGLTKLIHWDAVGGQADFNRLKCLSPGPLPCYHFAEWCSLSFPQSTHNPADIRNYNIYLDCLYLSRRSFHYVSLFRCAQFQCRHQVDLYFWTDTSFLWFIFNLCSLKFTAKYGWDSKLWGIGSFSRLGWS